MNKILRSKRILDRSGLTVDGSDMIGDVVKWELDSDAKDKDRLTYSDVDNGSTTSNKLKITAIVSTHSGSFWRYLRTNAGKVKEFLLSPNGNKVATADEPHYKCSARIPKKPGMSGAANEEKGSTFDIELEVIGEPEELTADSTMGTGSMEE